MELKEFVSQSLLQIFEGIQQAQSQLQNSSGKIVPAYPYLKNDNGTILSSNNSQPIVLIDFDVSLTTVDASTTKGTFGIFVAAFGGGAQAGSESSNNQFSHLKFSIPVLLPRTSKETN